MTNLFQMSDDVVHPQPRRTKRLAKRSAAQRIARRSALFLRALGK